MQQKAVAKEQGKGKTGKNTLPLSQTSLHLGCLLEEATHSEGRYPLELVLSGSILGDTLIGAVLVRVSIV